MTEYVSVKCDVFIALKVNYVGAVPWDFSGRFPKEKLVALLCSIFELQLTYQQNA